MRILYFREGSRLKPGIHTAQGIFDIDRYQQDWGEAGYGRCNFGLDDLEPIAAITQRAMSRPEYFYDEETLRIGPPVPCPSKIICIGLNYRRHALESGMAIPEIPVVFTKYPNTLADYGQDIPLGSVGRQFDYEVELGVVIGKKARHVPVKEALGHVLGYCVANDLSCRDLQFRTSQWLMGKTLDHFLPLGKWMVTQDEIPDPQLLGLRTRVNGELRQDSNTADMIFSVAEIIADLSRHFTLEPGDLIITGTPEGVAMGMKDPEWLKPGDLVEVEIDQLGHTLNRLL